MSKNYSWQEHLDKTLQNVIDNGRFQAFRVLTSNVERIKWIEDVHLIKEFWERTDLNDERKKSSCKSKQCREMGNKYFSRKQNTEALEFYNKSIQLADFENGNELALGFANRSAVLWHLEQYQTSLDDISWALYYGYPSELKYKLLQRKGQCFQALGRIEEGKKALGESKELLEKAALEDVKKSSLIKNLEKLMACNSTEQKSESRSSGHSPIPSLSYGANSTVLQATEAMELHYSKELGRHLLAKQPIKAGDVLIVEKPFAAVLLPTHYHSHCHHCFGKVLAPLPCFSCSEVGYCSDECRNNSWKKYHSIECQFLWLLHMVGIAHLSLRVVLVAGLKFLLDFRGTADKEAKPAIPGLSEEGTYERNYLSVYNLMPHTEHLLPEDLFQYSLTAALLLKCLKESPFFSGQESLDNPMQKPKLETVKLCTEDTLNTESQDCTRQVETLSVNDKKVNSDSAQIPTNENDKLYIGNLLLHHICQLVCNAHAITELQVTESIDKALVEGTSQVRVATAIYPTTSLLNHSCTPSIISSFHKDVLVVRAVKDISPGEEVFNCYGPHSKRMERSERQQLLQEQYFFNCHCEACEKDQSKEDMFMALKCCKCSGPLVGRNPENGSRVKCLDCNYMTDIGLQMMEVINSRDFKFNGLQQLEQGNVKAATKLLEKSFEIQENVCYKHNRELSETTDALARCYATLGLYKEAGIYLEKSISTTSFIFGENSIELANELQKYAEVLFNSRAAKKCLQTIDKAIEIFTMNYGDGCQQITELEKMKSFLKTSN